MSQPPSAQPPLGQAFDRQAELAVVGGILLDNTELTQARLILDASDFFDSTVQTIFKACCELADASTGIDLVTLSNQLKSHGKSNWLDTLVACTAPSASHTKHYAEIVKRYSLARLTKHTAIDINQGMAKVIAEGADLEDAKELLASTGRIIMDAELSLKATGPRTIDIIVGDTLKHIDNACDAPGGVTGIPTRISGLNELMGGWQGSQLTVIGARPGMGKSAIALDWAIDAAKSGAPVLFQSLEMSERDLGYRAVGQIARMDTRKLQRGEVKKEDWPALIKASSIFEGLPIHIDTTPNLTFSQFKAQATMYKQQYNVRIIFVDYLQLLSGSEEAKAKSRELEVAEISRGMAVLSKSLDIPIVCLVQLNRKSEDRPDKRPQKSDLRESGSLEQDADNILFLYPELEKGETWTNDIGLILEKQRNGPVGEVALTFERQYATFTERIKQWSDF